MKSFIQILIVALVVSSLTPAAFAKTTLTLSEFLNEVRSRSPDLELEKANIDAAEARASGIRINPPMIGLMEMKEQEGNSRGYEISQEIPFPTKIIQDKKVRNLELETQKESSNYQKVLLFADARNAYLNFWSVYTRLNILKEKHEWLKHHLKISRTSSWSDTEAKIHLLEVESDADILENEVLSLQSELVDKQNALRIFAPGIQVESIVPAEPMMASVQIEKANSSPTIVWKEKELEARNAMLGLKKQAYLPDFFVRLRSFNGNDASLQSQELMVGINLPFLFFWQPRAEVAESSAQRMKAEIELQKSRIDFESKLSSLSKKAQSLELQIKNLKDKLIPRAEKRMKLVRNVSQRTMEGLDQHRSIMLSFLDFKTKAIELRLEHENTIREILKLTGNISKVGGQ